MRAAPYRPVCMILLSSSLILAAGGCSMGPKILRGNRLDYNISLQKSNNEDLLVNLVRARFFDPLFFLQVGSVSSTFNYGASVGASAALLEKSSKPGQLNTYHPSLGASIAEAPTIIYAPLQGSQAVKQLLSEISADKIMLLVRTGWDLNSVIWMTVQRLGPLSNFDPGWKRDSPRIGSYGKFLELTQMMSAMQENGALEFSGMEQTESGVASLIVALTFDGIDEYGKMAALLDLRRPPKILPDGRCFKLLRLTTVGTLKEDEAENVQLKLRSFLGVLYDLSQSYPEPVTAMEEKTPPRFTALPEGIRAKKGLHEGLIRVRTSDSQPSDAFVAVFYRDKWHYISDSDPKSKGHFTLLGILFALQSAEVPVVQPVLTLPAATAPSAPR